MPVETSNLGDGIALVTMAGKSATQSFSMEFLPQIAEAIDSALSDNSIKAVVITGEGKFFSAGADINAFAKSIENNDAPKLIRDLTGILHPLIVRIRQSPTICVAAINGACAGGGLGLALACDVRIATSEAKIAASYSGMGLSPDGGTTWLLPRLVGTQNSRKFFFENSIWNAQQSLDYGAIDELVESSELLSRATEVAKLWSSWGPHTKEY